MRKVQALFAVSLVVGLLCGCGCSGPAPAFVAGVDAFVQSVGTEYVAYVNADPALTVDQKEIRFRNVDLLRKLLVEVKRGAQPAPAPPLNPAPAGGGTQ